MEWHHSVDVLVMGSGGAGQCAAVRAHDLGLEVLIVEKGDTWGGSTAMSAGAVWLPNNRAMKALGLEDSEDEGVKYLAHLTGGTIPEERLRTFIREGNRMIDYLADAHAPAIRLAGVLSRLRARGSGWAPRRAFARSRPLRRQRAR